MPPVPKIAEVQKEVERLSGVPRSVEVFMSEIVKLLHARMLKYNWVGFYMLEEPADSQPAVLALGAFQGAMTPHTRIPLNKGICGAAASTGKTVVVDDVSVDDRYLACSTETKSEIVVPVFVRGKVVGELDIDSHFSAAFGEQDRKFVEYCASLVGQKMEKSRASSKRHVDLTDTERG
jgi:L-methionine (R)-S-oxide reductase